MNGIEVMHYSEHMGIAIVGVLHLGMLVGYGYMYNGELVRGFDSPYAAMDAVEERLR